eukprot:CAMPEP_0203927886 /NCGR_PEP_ID=MMETSP0359-20131031/67247_1 /ASSEMBLY_ACC=CAM_ASM_000338 /TAXON_ID=268821 /ORGANISM="Scrippsiella Hangoei, Strain SHTV-5" /LENGTH=111 /DNA_ID=CAMNT_0050856737 /DNA_START=353 /DNA_END=688 /DNA_ORIENTATION=-
MQGATSVLMPRSDTDLGCTIHNERVGIQQHHGLNDQLPNFPKRSAGVLQGVVACPIESEWIGSISLKRQMDETHIKDLSHICAALHQRQEPEILKKQVGRVGAAGQQTMRG